MKKRFLSVKIQAEKTELIKEFIRYSGSKENHYIQGRLILVKPSGTSEFWQTMNKKRILSFGFNANYHEINLDNFGNLTFLV